MDRSARRGGRAMKLGWVANSIIPGPISLVTQLRWRFWYARIQSWLWLPALVLILVSIPPLVSILENRLPSVARAFDHGAAATLAGAVLGGVLALYASIRVQRHEVRLRAAVSRRDEVFEPLYEELLALGTHLERNPCPYKFHFNADVPAHHNPCFAVWPSFKEDSRRLRVPELLADALDELLAAINRYTSAYAVASGSPQVKRTIKSIIVSELGEHQSGRKDLAHHYLPCSQNLSKIKTSVEDEISMASSVKSWSHPTGVDADAVAERLYRECTAIDSVRQLQVVRTDVEARLDELTEAIEAVIIFINKRFEQHERWF